MSETLEEAILIAVLNEDEAEAERLASGMLPREMVRLNGALDRMQRLVSRLFWENKREPAAAPIAAPGREER